MQILDFLNSHLENWEEILTQEPYYIKIKRDGEYILLSYSQLNSDFTNPIVRECRGSIFKIVDGQFKCVCMPFYKFANYGESYADTINWHEATVTEKIDGSLIKVWYDKGWHVSTNGTIDAYKATIDAYPNLTFGDVFDHALGDKKEEFLGCLNRTFTHMFELVSPMNRVVISYYETQLYYIAARDMQNFQEAVIDKTSKEILKNNFGILSPTMFNVSTLSNCLDLVQTFDKNQEGIVVSDNQFHRIKIKSPEYLIAAHAANNGVMGLSTALDLIRREAVDDFKAYCDIHNKYLNHIEFIIRMIENDMEAAWRSLAPEVLSLGAKERAAAIRNYPNRYVQDYIFKKCDNQDLTPFTYLFHTIRNSALEIIVKFYRENLGDNYAF